jgi:hypothetical protein
MKLFNWLVSFLWNNPHFTGVLEDKRLSDEKKKDWLHEERTLATVTDPFSYSKIIASPYFYENQRSTSSCVPHGVGLALAIERNADQGQYQRISQMFPYRLRSNYPSEGCYLQNIFDIYRSKGSPLFSTLPTPEYEREANALTLSQQMYTEAEIFKGLSYFTVATSFNNIGTLASIASQGHAVSILFYSSYDEWSRQYPALLEAGAAKGTSEVVHCVTVLPHSGFMENGTRYVAVQDSAWFGGWKLRYVSEDFIKSRVYAAAYWDTVSTLGIGPKPKFTFTVPLRFGDRGNEVVQMQNLLISEGLLPSDMNTGYFGGRTFAAVKAFQERYANDILVPNSLIVSSGYWGNYSIKKGNELCA